MKNNDHQKTRIICCGNLFHGDDAAGLEVLKNLRQRKLPGHIDLVDGGTIGLGILHYLSGCYQIIIVDAVLSPEMPGSVKWYFIEDFTSQHIDKMSCHALNLVNILFLWQQNVCSGQHRPQVTILGIHINHIKPFCDTISPEVINGAHFAADLLYQKIISHR